MTGKKKELKQDVVNYLTIEIDNKNSVVISAGPTFEVEPGNKVKVGHAYAVIGYNQEYKAIKLYDPRCDSKVCVLNEKLHHSLTQNTDASKGELWVTTDQLENRRIAISSLHSKNLYKSVFESTRKIKLSAFNKYSFISLDTCEVIVEETTTFMINLFSYSHALDYFNLIVTTADDKRKRVKLKYELPNTSYCNKKESTSKYYQRFELKPNTYVCSLEFRLSKDRSRKEELYLLMKIGSVSKCTFKELHLKAKQFEFCNIL